VAAAAVHYVVAVLLEGVAHMNPAWANVTGFCVAFPVSYVGHYTLSFATQHKQHVQALPKFLLVAILGFVINQTLVLLCLRLTLLPFWLVLGLVMVIVAMMTYLLSKYWAFVSA
jgi:putative flippase GtrA